MTYQILIQPAARRQLKKLPSATQQKLVAIIEALSKEPRPSGCKKLKGRQNQYRVRSGDYRIVYSVEAAMCMRISGV